MSVQAAELLRVCQAALPDQTGLDVRSINPLAGKQHTVTAFHLIREGRRMPLILRRYPSPLGWTAFDDPHKARREFEVVRWLSARGLPVPEPLAVGCDEQGDWLLEHAISGRQWWMPMGGVVFNNVLPGLVRQQVSLLVRLHSLELADLSAEAACLPTITVPGVLATCTTALYQTGDRHLLTAIKRVSTLMRDVTERPPHLVQMNVEMENLLVDGQRQIVGWLDWDQAALGDPRWDVAALVNSIYGAYHLPELAVRAVASYGSQTVQPIKDIKSWAALIAILRWAQCCWLADQIKRKRNVQFPACSRFVNAYGSHRAWAIQLLDEAEKSS